MELSLKRLNAHHNMGGKKAVDNFFFFFAVMVGSHNAEKPDIECGL